MNTLGYASTFPSESVTPSEPARRATPEGYEIIECLGRGGCASVYEARHAEHGLVAIKISELARTHGEESDRRLEREAMLAQRVSHPNVLRVIDLGHTEDGAPFLVMERLRGEDLESLLARVGPLPVEVACAIVLETLLGLEAVHEAGIVHRDLKPNNIVLHVPERWGAPMVKLIDFGVARSVGGEKLTRTGTVIGTPQYLAPEQARGQKVDARADVWAMGIVFFELLAGEGPFEGANLQETLASILFADVPSVRERADVPEPIAAVIDKALSKDPEARYESARAMRDALERALLESDVEAPSSILTRVSVMPRTSSFIRAASLGGADTVSGVRARPASETIAQVAEASEPPRLPRKLIVGVVMAALVAMTVAWTRGEVPARASSSTQSAQPTRADGPGRSAAKGSRLALGGVVSPAQGPEEVAPAERTAAPRGTTSMPTPSRGRGIVGGGTPEERRARQLVGRGRAALSRGRVQEAYEVFGQATSADPDSAEAWRNYGLAAYQLGYMGDARRAMRRYRSLSR